MNTLEDLASLQANWDGYNAKPIDPVCIAHTKAFLDQLKLAKPVDCFVHIFPVPSGTVQVEVSLPNKFVEIEFTTSMVLCHQPESDKDTRFFYTPDINTELLKLLEVTQ